MDLCNSPMETLLAILVQDQKLRMLSSWMERPPIQIRKSPVSMMFWKGWWSGFALRFVDSCVLYVALDVISLLLCSGFCLLFLLHLCVFSVRGLLLQNAQCRQNQARLCIKFIYFHNNNRKWGLNRLWGNKSVVLYFVDI